MKKHSSLLIGLLVLICVILTVAIILCINKISVLNKELIKANNETKNEAALVQEGVNKIQELEKEFLQDKNKLKEKAEELQKRAVEANAKNEKQSSSVAASSKASISSSSSSNISSSSSSSVELTEEQKNIKEARNYFADRGIKLANSYAQRVVKNSGISDLDEHKVFSFAIENYDIKDNAVWFYYSSETKVGYRYENDVWTKVE